LYFNSDACLGYPDLSSLLSDISKQSSSRYTTLLQACSLALEFQGACYIWSRMEKDGITPDDTCYTALAHMLHQGKDKSKAEGVPHVKDPIDVIRQIVARYVFKY
jgi:pentatricopeptide repeat protein